MVTGIQPGSLYQRMGMADGDVIQGSTSGTSGPPRTWSALQRLRNAATMSLTIRRSGGQETLNYLFR